MNRDLEPIFHIYEYEEGIRKIAAHVVSEFKKRTFSVSEVSDADKSIDFNVWSDLFYISNTQKQNDALTLSLKIYSLDTCLVPRNLRGLTCS